MSTTQMSYLAHARAVLVLGLPLIGGHLGQVAIGVTDTVMLGWYGVEELAALGVAGSLFFVMFLMGSGFAWAVMPMVASFHAEGDETNLRRATRMGIWLSLGFAVCALPVMLMAERVLLALGQTDQVAKLGAEYLSIAGWGIVPALLVMTIKSYLAALERTQIVLWITLAAAVANAFANYAFIFGNWGAPTWGIAGAAVASLLTQFVMLAGIVGYALIALPQHQLFKRFWRPDWEMLGRVFRLGWPIGLTNLSEVGLFAASAFMMGWLGTIPLAAHNIALQLASITFMVHLGLSNVATIRAGNAYGRGDLDHMLRGARTVIVMSLAMALATIILFIALPEPLISLFMERDEPARDQILEIGIVLLALAALFQLVDGAQVIALGLLRGVQDTKVPMVLAAVSYWLVGMPASYVLGFVLGWEGVGVWLGLVFGLACAGVALMIRFWTVSVPRLRGPVGSGAVPAP
ncbi:MATE family efflux transporter [Tateyamaria sp. ANG-S1]|uniref:MATE family efflux transporter n=1 Tax=Tateyamaria sp. ANG-S1 TaxID=1577905 RepID=UPI00057C67E8|nr:MATE family efflux transporter [Tateyamaria sp. ANG-S1]KIC50770.1 multidrug transporter MatE [Tateyamaria sp. ANG-S1]